MLSGLGKHAVNPMWPEYGAKFDGSTDDTAAIQAALDSGASVVQMPPGQAVCGDLDIPQYVSLLGAGIASATSTMGTTLLYYGTGECIRSEGVQNVVPAMHTRLESFRIRKTTASSSKAAIALVSGAHITLRDIRIDTSNASYTFAYGVVFDQSEVCYGENIQVEGVSDTGIWLVNGADYTAGNSAQYTNVVTLVNPNINGCGSYGIAHDGGDTLNILGGNINDSGVGLFLGGLNNFNVAGVLFEAGAGQADVVLSQYNKSGLSSVGGCSGGNLHGLRCSSPTTNSIYIRGPGSPTISLDVRGCRFSSVRTGSAIGLSDADALLNSVIGPNINLGGVGLRYLDAGVYTYNAVETTAYHSQSEVKVIQPAPGVFSTKQNGRKVATTYTSVDYTVQDDDEIIHVSPGSTDKTIRLPPAADSEGRELHIMKKQSGTGGVIIDGDGSETINGSTTLTLANQYDAATIWCDGVEWFVK